MGLDIKLQQSQCPCCKACKDCMDFQKIVDLKDAGLVIYRHTARTEDLKKDTGLLETATNITEDVFILHNTKDVEITSADFVPALEPNKISCPRCRNIIEHAHKLLEKVPTIDKQDIMGVCDHCKRKERSFSPCYKCEEIVKKFVTSKDDKSENTKVRVKLWLSKIKHLLQDVRTDAEDSKKLNYRTRSEMYINRLPLYTSRPAHEPEINQLFHPETHRYDIIENPSNPVQNFQKVYDKKLSQLYLEKLNEPIIFVDSVKHPELFTLDQEAVSAVKTDTAFSSDETKAISVGKYKARDKNAQPELEKCTMAKEHRIMTPFQKYEGQKHQKNISELTSKIEPEVIDSSQQSQYLPGKPDSYLRQLENVHKVIGENDIAAKRGHTYQQSKLSPSIKPLEKFDVVRRISHSTFGKPYRETQTVKTRINAERGLENLSQITKYHSEETLLTSFARVTDDFLKRDFRYVFPKEVTKTKKPKRLISSAELIKETQDMLLERAEEERKKIEEERKKKFEEEEIKRFALEEKKKLADEKKKAEKETRKAEEKSRKVDEEMIKPKVNEIQKAEEVRKDAVKNKNEFERNVMKDEKRKQIIEDKTLKSDKRKKDFIPSVPDTTLKSKSEKSNNTKPKGGLMESRGNINKEAPKADSPLEMFKKDTKGQEGKNKRQKNEKQDKELLKQDKPQKSNMGNELKQKEIAENKNKNKKEETQREKSKPEQHKTSENIDTSKEQTGGKDKDGDDQFKKLLAEQAKQKDEELKRKKQQEQSEKLAREAAERKAKESETFKKTGKEGIADSKQETEKSKQEKTAGTSNIKELNINQIKLRKASDDDLILQLVKVKKSDCHTERIKPSRLSELNISPVLIEEHKEHRNKKQSKCLICIDSNLELDIESIVLKTNKSEEMANIIIGPKVFKYKPPLVQKKEEEGENPLVFQSFYNEEIPFVKDNEILSPILEEPKRQPLLPTKSAKTTDQEIPKGIVRYALSDRTFIDKGWTLLPTEKVVRKMNVYRMRPAHPEFDWFEHNKKKRLMLYDTGEKLAEFDDNGRGRWYYRNGCLALDYYDAEETNAQQRFVVYSSGEPDERGRTHPITILATFDYLGNGIVFDHGGKIRLKYNQTEGVVLDRGIGPVSHWKWHTLNDPPVLQQVMIDTQMAHKDPEILKMGGTSDKKTRQDNEEMLAIEFDNFIKEKSKKLSQTFKPFQIKMKAMKINEHFSLKVLDQATVYLIFRDGTTNLKLNIGMILDHKEIVDTDTAELGEVSNNLERFPARTESLAGLQRSVAYVQRFERSRTERERRLHPAEPCASADQLTAAVSRPLRPPLRSVRSSSTASTKDCYCKCSRKPSSFNLYYDTRLI